MCCRIEGNSRKTYQISLLSIYLKFIKALHFFVNLTIVIQYEIFIFQLDMENGDDIDVFQQPTGGLLWE